MEPIRNLFTALFLSSIGMLIHVHFLWNHVDILLASLILVIVVKTTIAATVTKTFGYSIRTSFHVSWLAMLVGKKEKLKMKILSFIFPGHKLMCHNAGWSIACLNWRICFCSPESCLQSSSHWGDLSLSLSMSVCAFLLSCACGG